MNDAPPPAPLANGPGAAAILAAGVASAALGVLALASDAWPAVHRLLNVWRPTGPLSGVTTATTVIWLASWAAFHQRWAQREVELKRINLIAFGLLAVGLLLTFPPLMDLIQGK